MVAVTGDRPTLGEGIRSLILFRCDNKTAVVTTVFSQVCVEGDVSTPPTRLTTTHIVKLLVCALLLLLLFVEIDRRRRRCHYRQQTGAPSQINRTIHILYMCNIRIYYIVYTCVIAAIVVFINTRHK
jgi:hypothetical protein